MVNWENYEEYLILHTDGELDVAAEAALMAFIATHPELKAELAVYEAARLVPDETLVFGQKTELLRPEPARRTIALKHWWAYGAAAGLALLAGVLLWPGGHREVQGLPAAGSLAARQHPFSVKDSLVHEAPVAAVVPEQQRARQSEEFAPATGRGKNGQVPIIRMEPMVPVLALAEDAPLPSVTAEAPLADRVAVLQPEQEPPGRNQTLAAAALGGEKLEGLNMIREAAIDQVNRVRKLREDLRGTDLAVCVGSRELFKLHF